ncbi:hypothetical protein [Pseudonocardia sp. GCM10023141]|uniref:hypothetical protein n=1 Tax=Pseudonocardia sp. GCM10023141 TaxID=3252653 RepID=UPI00360E3338
MTSGSGVLLDGVAALVVVEGVIQIRAAGRPGAARAAGIGDQVFEFGQGEVDLHDPAACFAAAGLGSAAQVSTVQEVPGVVDDGDLPRPTPMLPRHRSPGDLGGDGPDTGDLAGPLIAAHQGRQPDVDLDTLADQFGVAGQGVDDLGLGQALEPAVEHAQIQIGADLTERSRAPLAVHGLGEPVKACARGRGFIGWESLGDPTSSTTTARIARYGRVASLGPTDLVEITSLSSIIAISETRNHRVEMAKSPALGA